MDIITYVICGIGAYWLAYRNHCAEVDRHIEQVRKEAEEENFHRTEAHIKEMHRNGAVFGSK